MNADVSVFYQKALKLLHVGRPADAQRELAHALALEPDDPLALTASAWASLSLNDLDAAERSTERALSCGPELEWPHRMRSVILLRRGLKEEALCEARTAVALDPEEPVALRHLCDVQLELGHVDDALQTAQQLLEVAPQASSTFLNLGVVQLRLKRASDAEATFRQAIALDPQSALAHNNLGVALQRQGKEKAALDKFVAAARIDPRLKTARTNVGTAKNRYLSVVTVVIVSAVVLDLAAPLTDAEHHPGRLIAVILVLAAAIVVWYRIKVRRLPEIVRRWF